MGNILILIPIIILSFLCNSAFNLIISKTRIKRLDTDFSKYIYYSPENETAEDTFNILDSCNISVEEDLNDESNKRSVDHSYVTFLTTTEKVTEEIDISFVNDEFLMCPLIIIEPDCYEDFKNGSVYVPLYDMLFNRANYLMDQDLLLVCPHFFKRLEDKFSSKIDTVSIVGISISTACIILHIIMFCLIEKMRNIPGYCILSLCSALLIAYTCSFIQYSLSEHNCTAIGIVVFYSMLSSFFWMNVISYDVWESIRLSTTKLRLSTTRPVLVRFILYSLYGWGVPLLIVTTAILIDHITTNRKFKLDFRADTCWFQQKFALFIYFALPLCIVLFVNILFFIFSFRMITQNTVTRRESGFRDNLKSRLFLTLRLISAMGFMWIFGLIASVTQREWIFFLYAICNALQGVFIFFSFTVNEKTIKACKTVIRKKKSSILPENMYLKDVSRTQYNAQ